MKSSVPVTSRLCLAGLAVAGLIGAHHFGYFLAAPDPHDRSARLALTGHGYWRYLVALAVGLVVAGLARVAFDRVRGRHTNAPRSMYGYTAGLLLILQVGGFLLLEGIERAAVGLSAFGILTEQPVLMGLALQLALALLGALVLVAFITAIDVVVELVQDRPPAETQYRTWETIYPIAPRLRVAAGSGTWRGPPRTTYPRPGRSAPILRNLVMDQ